MHSATSNDKLLIGLWRILVYLKGNLGATEGFFQPDRLGCVSGLINWQGVVGGVSATSDASTNQFIHASVA
jgi:hypothetical protein